MGFCLVQRKLKVKQVWPLVTLYATLKANVRMFLMETVLHIY